MPSGFFDLGNAIVGGDIDREGARLEGLNLGSQIQARRATTTKALADARLRVDEAEAKEDLADAMEELFGDQGRALAVQLRSGGTIKDVMGGLLEQQELGFRGTIADDALPLSTRQSAAQAVEGKVVDPFQISGGLAASVFEGDLQPAPVTPTGAAQIGANEALARQRDASAALNTEKRLHPDRFKASTKATPDSLAEAILPGGQGTSIVPGTINAEEAFGAEAFFKGGTNAVSDFIGLGTPFEDEAQANEVLGNLAVRTQMVMQSRVPGRPSQFLLQLLGTYAEKPRELFRGDAKAIQRLENTVATLNQDLQRTKDALNSPTAKTPTRQGQLEDALFSIADLVADYEAILASLQQPGVAITPQEQAVNGVTQTASGGSFSVSD